MIDFKINCIYSDTNDNEYQYLGKYPHKFKNINTNEIIDFYERVNNNTDVFANVNEESEIRITCIEPEIFGWELGCEYLCYNVITGQIAHGIFVNYHKNLIDDFKFLINGEIVKGYNLNENKGLKVGDYFIFRNNILSDNKPKITECVAYGLSFYEALECIISCKYEDIAFIKRENESVGYYFDKDHNLCEIDTYENVSKLSKKFIINDMQIQNWCVYAYVDKDDYIILNDLK